MLKNILVLFDFSSSSFRALETAIAIASGRNASLRLLHCLSHNIPIVNHEGISLPSHFESLARMANDDMYNLVQSLSKTHAIKIEGQVEFGQVPFIVCKVAWEMDADLIITGRPGFEIVKRPFAESIYSKLLKTAPCPLLLLPSDKSLQHFQNILFPVRDASGTLEKYFPLRWLIGRDSLVMLTGLIRTNEVERGNQIRERVETIRSWLRTDRVRSQAATITSDSLESQVMEIVRAKHADLLAISCQVHRSNDQSVLEYFASTIVQSATCAVLAVRADMEALQREAVAL